MKSLSTLMALGVLLALSPTSAQATTFTTNGDKIYKDGERFFILGVYFQNRPSWSSARNHPDGWLELESHRFNALNLLDPFPQPCGTLYPNSYNVTFEGFISANSTNIPWLASLGTHTQTSGPLAGTYGGPYNTPSGSDLSPNAREIMTHAADHGIYVIADQVPFTPDGARELDGSIKREYGVSGVTSASDCQPGTGVTDVINATMRETMIDDLTRADRWSAWGKDHANFLGWSALDEPLWFWQPDDRYAYNATDIENRYNNLIAPSYTEIKDQDSDHLVFMNFAYAHATAFGNNGTLYSSPSVSYNSDGELIVNGDNILEKYVNDLQMYAASADVLSIDIYPIYNNGGVRNPSGTSRYNLFQDRTLSAIGKYQRLLNEEVLDHAKPALAVLQAWTHGLQAAHILTDEEVRFQAYDAIINGADGLMWFGWHVWGETNDETWNRTKAFVRDELGDPILYPVLSADTSPHHNSVSVNTDDIEFLLKEYNGQQYLLAANTSHSTTHSGVTFSGLRSC